MRRLVLASAAVVAAAAVIAPAAASAQPRAVTRVTVTVASCTVSATSTTPASCEAVPVKHDPSPARAYKVFSFTLHVKANPPGQYVTNPQMSMTCTGPRSSTTPPVPAAAESVIYSNPVTPVTSPVLTAPYQRYCSVTAQASVPQGTIHVYVTAVITKGAEYT